MGEFPRGFFALDLEFFRERGDEGLGERAFGKEVAQEVGDLEGEVEAVHPAAAAVEAGEHHFARETEHAAGHDGGADFPCGFGRGHVRHGESHRQEALARRVLCPHGPAGDGGLREIL